MESAGQNEARGGGRIWIIVPVIFVVLYFLSVGPVMLWVRSRLAVGAPPQSLSVIVTVYGPMEWLYDHTPLHKPIGIYLHLWIPDKFDSKGNEI